MAANKVPTVASLNAGLFDLVATMPKARTELVDFYFKDKIDEYVRAIQVAPGRKTVSVVASSADASTAIRRAMIVADLVTFNVDAYIQAPALALLPIPHDFASSIFVLMAMQQTGSDGPWRPISLEAWLLTMESIATGKIDPSLAAQLFGTEWTREGTPRWERTQFAFIDDHQVTQVPKGCQLVGGLSHVQIPAGDNLLADVEPLMRSGRVAFAPFFCGQPTMATTGEGILKSDMLDSAYLTGTAATAERGVAVDPLLGLEIPYLENIPLPLLAKVLDDEGESLAMFRRKLDRAVEDLASAKDAADASRRVVKLKREELEDELDKVRQVCEKVSRMHSIARTGAYVAATALSVGGVYGLALPSVIAGCSAPIAAALKALYDAYEAKREARRSSMYFVWRLSKVVPR